VRGNVVRACGRAELGGGNGGKPGKETVMDQLKRQIWKARWRLAWRRFLNVAACSLCGTLIVALVAIATPKLVALQVDPTRWPWIWLGGAVVLALILAAVWTWLTSRGDLDAAIELDLRYNLKERISSSLALSAADRETSAGRALVGDAQRVAQRIDVADRFPIGVGRIALLPLLPAALAFMLVLLVDDKGASKPAGASVTAATEQQIKKSTDALRRKLIERRKRAEKEGLKEAEELLKKLEMGTRELSEKKGTDKKKALLKLNDLARQLQQRRQAIGGNKAMRQQLNQLKKLNPGPGDRLVKALKKGDFAEAAKQLKQLEEKIRSGQLDAQAKNQLAKQLNQMREKLNKAAAAHQAAMDKLQKQLDQARAAGDQEKVQQLEQALGKLAAQKPQMDQLQDLANQLGMCAQCMKQGDGQGACNALGKLAADLQAMQIALDELELLDDALAQLGQCKAAMACAMCGGAGCQQCQGPPRSGLGPGQGFGPRPEEETDTSAYDSQVRQRTGRGRAVITGLVEGPNVKGQVIEQIQAEVRAGPHRDSDPLADRRLPRAQREHAQEFFDSFREGKLDRQE
jgi:hypothetical protein